MNILSMLGLMKVEDHEAAIAELDDANYLAWSKMANERDGMSASRADMMQTIAKMQVENKRLATAGEKQAETDGKQPDRARKPKARAKKDARS